MYVNLFTCAGNLTADPVLHYTKNGTPWCSGGVALNKPIPPREAGDEWRSETTFVDWTAWGKLAQRCADKLHRGDGVLLVGELRGEEWPDKKTGEQRRKLRMHVSNVQRYRVSKGKKDEVESVGEPGEDDEELEPSAPRNGEPGDDVPF